MGQTDDTRPIAGGSTVAAPTFGDVNRDVIRTLEFPGSLYFGWMSIIAHPLSARIPNAARRPCCWLSLLGHLTSAPSGVTDWPFQHQRMTGSSSRASFMTSILLALSGFCEK